MATRPAGVSPCPFGGPGAARPALRPLVVVIAAEREVDAHQGLLLLFADVLVGHDRPGQVGGPVGGLEDAGLDVEGLGGDTQRLGDLLEDLGRGPAQPALDLAQVRVRDAGQLRETAQREARRATLLTDERAQIVPAV